MSELDIEVSRIAKELAQFAEPSDLQPTHYEHDPVVSHILGFEVHFYFYSKRWTRHRTRWHPAGKVSVWSIPYASSGNLKRCTSLMESYSIEGVADSVATILRHYANDAILQFVEVE